MTTLTSIEAVQIPRSRRSGDTFLPVVGGDPKMADDSPAACSGRWKRELQLAGGEQPPPAKRMSPVPPRGLDPATRESTDPSRSAHLAGLNLGVAIEVEVSAHATSRYAGGTGPRERSCQSLPFRSDEQHSHHAREAAQAIGRAHTMSPTKTDATPSNTNTIKSDRPTRSLTMTERSVAPPPKLWEKVPSASLSVELLVRPSATLGAASVSAAATATGARVEGGAGQKATSASLPMVSGYRRDVLKPSPQQNAGANCAVDGNTGLSMMCKNNANINAAASTTASVHRDSGGECGGPGFGGGGDQRGTNTLRSVAGDDSPGGSRRSMKRPLGGGLRASSSWDGGSASNAPPGSGGGFSAAPACRCCGGGGVRDNGGDTGEGADSHQGETCSCKGVRTSLCLSPLPFFRGTNSDGVYDGRRCGIGEEDIFSDHMLSNAFSPPSSPAFEPHGVGSGAGVGGEGSGVDGLEMLSTGGEMHDIADCMRTLQGSPTHDATGPADHAPLSFSLSFDGGAQNDVLHAGASERGDARHGGGDMDVESPDSRLGGSHSFDGADANDGTRPMAAGNDEPGPKLGDNHQAVIPTLSTLTRSGDARLSPEQLPSLQLWKPGTVSDAAATFAFPPPQRGGAGSAELEQKMLAAYLVSRAEEEEGRQKRGNAVGVAGLESGSHGRGLELEAGTLAGATISSGGMIGSGFVGNSAVETASSLESLSKLVADGEGARWRTDWPVKDRDAFRRGVFAFRRDFHRIRAKFLPEKSHCDVVEYFYRRWKRDPEYAAWKSTEQLVGRRVAKVPGFEGQFAALRRGWVVCKESSPSGGFEQMFRVVFPKVGSFPAEKQIVDLGTLETMLAEGSVTEEERTSEAMGGPRVAASRGALISSSHHHFRHGEQDGDRGTTLRMAGGGGGGGHRTAMGLGVGLAEGVRGRRLGWNSPSDPMYDHMLSGVSDGRGDGREDRDSGDEARSRQDYDDEDGEEEEEEADEDEEEEEEEEEETEENEGDSGPEAETDSTTSISAGDAGVSPVSTSHASFARGGGGEQSSTRFVEVLAGQRHSPSSFSPVRVPLSQRQQEEQQLLLQRTPPLLPQPREKVEPSCTVDRSWEMQVNVSAVENEIASPSPISEMGTGFGEQEPLGEDMGGAAEGGSMEATLVLGR